LRTLGWPGILLAQNASQVNAAHPTMVKQKKSYIDTPSCIKMYP
jgi:hypothetical protein